MSDSVGRFPSTLAGFGYSWKQGRLVCLKTGEAFQFNVSLDIDYNQARYEALGDVITDDVYGLLETECGLKRVAVAPPQQAGGGAEELSSFVFCSDGYASASRLLLLIHGSGAVRAGQWARRLIINDGLQQGSQIPYVKRALADGYGVIVLNTNDNWRVVGGSRRAIPGSASAEEHVLSVWDQLVAPAAAARVAVVAHSYGGVVTVHLAEQRWSQVRDRVTAVALTDSVHRTSSRAAAGGVAGEWLKDLARNWVASDLPLDGLVTEAAGDADRYSAGHTSHEWTSCSCLTSVFRFLETKMALTDLNKSDSNPSD